jgi:hypothetical protein
MALTDPFAENDYALYDDFYQLSGIAGYGEDVTDRSGLLSKPKNDNSRYTIMVRDASYFSASSASGNLVQTPGIRDPENAIYYPYEELKKIEIPSGFNSPEFISEEITRQLQKVNERKTRFTRSATDLINNPERPGYPIPMYQEFNAECYKAFNVASIYPDLADSATNNPETYYKYYINGSTEDSGSNGSGFEYLQNYHIVACKRPELYTTGRLINIDTTGAYLGIQGARVDNIYDGTFYLGTIGIILGIPYNKENVNKWRDFILAQEKYPEVFNIFSDSRTPYHAGDNIDNCRYCHINRYNNASMEIKGNFQLGHGGYERPTWKNNASANFNSLILPFQYDSSQKDIFYESPAEGRNQKSYGCFGRSNTGRMVIYPTVNNGRGSPLFILIDAGSLAGGEIEEGRRIGFDMHFSAPGNTWILPYSGLSQKPSNYDSRAALQTSYTLARNSETTILNSYTASTNFLRNKLYIGADAPKINWNGTNFSISDFHTAMNRGNEQGFEADWVDNVQDQDPQADDVVFKINPTEQHIDWTPARMPYVTVKTYTVQSGGQDKNAQSPIINSNYEPWTIYDSLCGINIEDFGLSENQWDGCLWDLLGFSYKQFHSSTNNRLQRIDTNNRNDLSVITTNALVPEGETKFYSQNMYGVPLYTNMLQRTGTLIDKHNVKQVSYYPPLVVKTSSIQIVADKLPTRMIRGYYTIRSNLLSETPFIGGKKNNTTMPIIGVVDKINGDGDFYFGQESSLEFTVTKPLKLASLTCSIHDPDGSYANTSEQNTVLFKIQKNKNVTFNVFQEILEENKGKIPPRL